MIAIDPTESQQRALNVLQRVAAGSSMICGMFLIYSVLRSQYYRRRIFHRIMMGCAIAVVLIACLDFWGSAAVPQEGRPGAPDHLIIGARGNTTTCTIQGYLTYVSAFAVPFYYISLSLLSLMAIRSNFKVQKYIWIEKYIHVAVYVVPLGTLRTC